MKKQFVSRLGTLLFVLGAIALIGSCASQPETESDSDNGLPDFFLNPPQADDAFYGVGSADMADLARSRRMAIARAREDIAFQMNAQVQASITDYAQEAGADGNDPQVVEFVETVSRQIADVTLEGATTDTVEEGPDGELFALVSYPMGGFRDAAEEAFSRNEDAAFADFQAEQALEELDHKLENDPSEAGNVEEDQDPEMADPDSVE